MIRLRPYKSCDAKIISEWIRDEDVFLKWGGTLFGAYPISAEIIDEKYRSHNGDCAEPDNFYPWVALDERNLVVGHFIMRYINGDPKTLRFGWVIVDDSIRGKGIGTKMLKAGLKIAFEIMDASVVTLGVYINNDLAHNCYRNVGFRDTELLKREPWDQQEMAIRKEDYLKI